MKKGRMRKAKKAYRTSEGAPLWWDGNSKKRKRQIRYFYFMLVKEWELTNLANSIMALSITVNSTAQVLRIRQQPRPFEMPREEFMKQQGLATAQIAIDTALALAKLPHTPKPRVNDFVKPAFTTCYPPKRKGKTVVMSNPGIRSWVEEGFLGVDVGEGRDITVLEKWTFERGVQVRTESTIQPLPPQA